MTKQTISLFFILIGLTFSNNVGGQNCGTIFSEKKIESLKAFYKNHDFSIQQRNQIGIPITIWRDDVYIFSLSDEEIFELIDEANEGLAATGISLFSWENKIRNAESRSLKAEPNNFNYLQSGSFVEGTLNIYFTGGIINNYSGVMLGHDYDAFNTEDMDAVFISAHKFRVGTVAHEVGHYLGLIHTFGNAVFRPGLKSVTDEKIDGSNCLQAGDLICDTPADPGNNLDGICTYKCSEHQSNSCNKEPDTNLTYDPDTENMMSYFNPCRSQFSNQQASILNAYASVNRSFRIPTSDCERDTNEPSYPDNPSFALSNTVETPPLIFKKSVSGKFDNSWDIDSYFMSLSGGNRNYKVTVISDIPAEFKIYRRDLLTDYTEHVISPGINNIFIISMPGAAHTKIFDIKPLLTPDCGNSYTITIENSDESCIDNNEPNNTKSLSTLMGQLSNPGDKISITGEIETINDHDYFKFTMNAKGYYAVNLVSVGSNYDFDFTYIDENNNEFTDHIKNGVGIETYFIENSSASPKVGYIRVNTKPDNYSCIYNYEVNVQFIDGTNPIPCTPDIYENNNTFQVISNPVFIGGDQSNSTVLYANIDNPFDVDLYNLILNKRGIITITLTDMPIPLFMDAGHRIGIADDENHYYPIQGISKISDGSKTIIQYEKSDDSPFSFFLAIMNLNDPYNVKCENYKLTIEWTPEDESSDCIDVIYEPNSTPSLSSNIFGSLRNEPLQTEINPKIGSDGDYDYFKIKLHKNGNLKFNIFSNHYPVRIELSKDGYNFFDSRNSTGTNDSSNRALVYDFENGNEETLYLRAYSPGNQFNCDFTYSLILEWNPFYTVDGGGGNCMDTLAEPNDNISIANNKIFNFKEVSESINGEFFISSPNDVDFFKIKTIHNGLLDVVLSNLYLDLDFDILDQNFNLVGSSKNNFLSQEKLTFVSNASEFYIKVYGKLNQFDCINKYKLTVNWQKEPECNDMSNNSISSAVQIANLSNVAKDSLISNHKISTYGERDYFRLNIFNTGTLHLVLSEGGLDFDMYLMDKNQNILSKSARYTGSDEIYYYISNTSQELYLYIEAKGFKSDCFENYIFSYDWTPQIENPVQNQYPCNSVITPNIAYSPGGDIYHEWQGNISSGQSKISNYYCDSGNYGKELVFEYYYDPLPEEGLRIGISGMQQPGLVYYLLDGCDPTTSYCYGKVTPTYWPLLGGYWGDRLFFNLEPKKKYYIFVDGISDEEYFELNIMNTEGPMVFINPTTGCGMPLPSFNYQCTGVKYNVLMNFTGYNIQSVTSQNYTVSKLSNTIYRINNVNAEDADFRVNYTSSLGFSCVADFMIPKYVCNVDIDNCFGLNPPFVPSKIEVCPEQAIPPINVFNPDNFKIEWFVSKQSESPIFIGNDFIPQSFGTYYIKFSDTLQFCQSDRVPVSVEQVPEIIFSQEITHNKCYGDNDGKIELILRDNTSEYEIYWNNSQVGSINDGLSAGFYSVTLYDKNQCKVQRSFRVSEPDKLYFLHETVNNNTVNLCLEDSVMINNSVTGGTPPFNLVYNGAQIPEIISLQEEGNYLFTAYDANVCVINRQVTVNTTYEIPIDFALDTVDNNIFLTCLALYENPGEWSTGEKTPTIEITQSGDYTIDIFDNFGCIQTKTIHINIVSSTSEIKHIRDLKIFPNPTIDQVKIEVFESTEIIVQDILGRFVKQLVVDSQNNIIDFSEHPTGLYVIKTGNGKVGKVMKH
ncbi:MAG: T9SS type A sorting domain-containing protein [Saprospiraceae bacterium]